MEFWLSTDAEAHGETDAPMIPVHTLSLMDRSQYFIGTHYSLDFTLGLFLSISGLFLPTETHFSGASRHVHPEGSELAEMLADAIVVLPQGYKTQREEGLSNWGMTSLWGPVLSRTNNVIGILMELSHGGPVTSYMGHSHAGPGRKHRKILVSHGYHM